MHTLLVHPAFPKTYWGMEYARLLTRRSALLPPLGLLTVAALLPSDWSVRLIDMSVEPLLDEDLAWADVVFVGAMQIQQESFHEVIRRAHSLGKTVIAGGAYPTTEPEAAGNADCVVIGESEELIGPLCRDIANGTIKPRYKADSRPDVTRSPVPRYDLLHIEAYQSIGVQFSRGCPFNCEFCDIIEVFGRVPRTKTPEQLLREFDAIYAAGFRGMLFLVDDNFIGNKRAAKTMLPEVAGWMRAKNFPFDIYTEASINLASDDRLIDLMLDAGFSSVFIGIETPSRESLAETQKIQNMRLDLTLAVEKLTRKGLEVMAGFIVGFDADDAGIFERQFTFIQNSPIPLAMVVILSALPGSQLWRRLEKEGRLVEDWSGENFGRANFQDPNARKRVAGRVQEVARRSLQSRCVLCALSASPRVVAVKTPESLPLSNWLRTWNLAAYDLASGDSCPLSRGILAIRIQSTWAGAASASAVRGACRQRRARDSVHTRGRHAAARRRSVVHWLRTSRGAPTVVRHERGCPSREPCHFGGCRRCRDVQRCE